jgi:hypothetical protein
MGANGRDAPQPAVGARGIRGKHRRPGRFTPSVTRPARNAQTSPRWTGAQNCAPWLARASQGQLEGSESMATTNFPSADKSGGIGITTTQDTGIGDRLVCWIDAPVGSWLESYVVVRDCFDPVGPKPGYAQIEIPVFTGHEKANQVAFGTPWRNLLHGARVVLGRQRAGYVTHWFWVGRVCTIDAQIEDDCLVVTAKDDRWMLQDVRIVGRFVCEPDQVQNNMNWQQGIPAIFNEGGKPNMMIARVTDDDGVGIPVFAPHPDYGLGNEAVPTSADDMQTKAGYWTISWILRYLSIFYGPGAASYYPSSSAVVPKLCPSGISWPRGLGAQIDTEASVYWDEGRGQSRGSTLGDRRKGRELDADGYAILDAVEMLIATAGGYTLGWEMRAEKDDSNAFTCTSVMSIQPAIYKGGVGHTVDVVRGGSASVQLTETGRYWTKGHYMEDSSDLVTSVHALGSLVKIETRVDTVSATLIPKWSSSRQAALAATGADLAVSDENGMLELFRDYPEVFGLYQLEPSFNFTSGTSESGYPRAEIPRPIMPHLLSWVRETVLDYAAGQFPVYIEASINGGATWVAISELVRLSVWDDGTIDLTALREVALHKAGYGSWYWSGTEYTWPSSIAAASLRMTVAIPCDHRLAAVAKLVNDTMAAGFDDVVESPDMARLRADFERQNVLDLRGLYHLWLRINSWPRPEASWSTPKATNKNTRSNPLRNDHDYLRAHGRRHLYLEGRLKRGGFLGTPQLITTVPNGYQIQSVRHHTADGTSELVDINATVRARHWTQSESEGQQAVETEILLA